MLLAGSEALGASPPAADAEAPAPRGPPPAIGTTATTAPPAPSVSSRPAVPADAPESLFHPRRVLVKVEAGIALDQLEDFHRVQGARVLRTFPAIGNLQVVEVESEASVGAVVRAYLESGLVAYAEPDFYVILYQAPPRIVPDDPRFGDQWALDHASRKDINAPEAWAIRSSAEDVVVAVVDTGVKLTHEDLAANLWTNPGEIPNNGQDDDQNGYVDDIHGINAEDGSGNPEDASGHGTHVAGIIGACGNNGLGVAGVAWQVRLMPLAFTAAPEVPGTVSRVVACLDYARAQGAHLVNASWGIPCRSQALYDALEQLRAAGIILVAAVGNDAWDTDQSLDFPSVYELDNIVSVAAGNYEGKLAYFSSYGGGLVDLVAPGWDILSTYISPSGPQTNYTNLTGTSMAAPHVSGALALARQALPAESARAAIYRLLAGVDTDAALVGKCLTAGRLNLQRLIEGTRPLAPANDNFESAVVLIGTHPTAFGVSLYATKQPGEPNHAGDAGGASVWWSWTAPGSGPVEITTGRSITASGGAFDTLLAVYTGSSLGSLTLVVQDDNGGLTAEGAGSSRAFFTASAGTTYRIAVDGRGGAQGFVRLNLALAPRNDSFATSTRLTGEFIACETSNLGASKQSGEAAHGGNAGGRSLWWSWTAPTGGTVSLTTAGSNFDTLLAVYTGSWPPALLAGNDDETDARLRDDYGGKTSGLTFTAQAGQTYHFAVDGKGGAAGRIVLAGGFAGSLVAEVMASGSSGKAITEAGHATGNRDAANAFLYANGQITIISSPGRSLTAYDLNEADVVVGQADQPTGTAAFRWWPGLNDVEILPGNGEAAARDINGPGIVAGNLSELCGQVRLPKAAYWVGTTPYALPSDGFKSAVESVGDDSLMVGWTYPLTGCSPGPMSATLWRLNGESWERIDLGVLGGVPKSKALSVGQGGTIAGMAWSINASSLRMAAAVWADWRMRSLGAHGASSTVAHGINSRDQIVGRMDRWVDDVRGSRAFLWENGVFLDLARLFVGTPPFSFPGAWWFREAQDINGRGQVVGTIEYYDPGPPPGWKSTAFLLTPPLVVTLGGAEFAAGVFQFTVRGAPGSVCTVETRETMETGQWTVLGNVTLGQTGSGTFQDTNSGLFATRFYRVRAGNELSRNAVGFFVREPPVGYSMVANPFGCRDNRVPALFPGAPEGLTVYKYDNATGAYRINAYEFGAWSDELMTLDPGEGIILRLLAGTGYTIRFAGEVMQNAPRREVLASWQVYGTVVPFVGALDQRLEFPIEHGDAVYRMRSDGSLTYDVYTYHNGTWNPAPPVMALGEAFWVNRSAAGIWRQNYAVW